MANTAGVEPVTDLYKFLMLIGAAMGLALYLQVLRNRFYWVVMETLLGVISVLCLPFTSTMIANIHTTGTNTLAEYLCKLMVFTRICQAAVVFLTRNSKDPTVAIGISVTNILSRTALLMCVYHGIYHTTTINKDYLKREIVIVSLLVIGDLFQISKVTTRDGSLTIGDPVSFHLAIDGLLKFVMASWIFGFPDMFLYMINPKIVPNEGQLGLAKMTGCTVFGLAVLSFAALCFKRNADGVAVLKAKLVFYLPSLLFGIILCVTDSQYQGPGHVVLVLGSMALLGANAVYAVWQEEKDKVC